jgi:hypothetical protein
MTGSGHGSIERVSCGKLGSLWVIAFSVCICP